MSTFNELLDDKFSKILEENGIKNPTEVQQAVIPTIINTTDDLIVTAKTGSGKTLSYVAPLFFTLDDSIKTPEIVILAPTHELASQIYSVCKYIDKGLGKGANPILLIGGANINKQMDRLKKDKPKIIIGSTGRILELVKLKKIKMHTVKTIVLDEGDRLVDNKNLALTKDLIKTTLKDQRRILYFSASIDDETVNTLSTIMKSPVVLEVNNAMTIPDTIENVYFICEKRDKIDLVRKIVNGLELKKVMVFVNNPITIETVTDKLCYHKLSAVGLHGEAKKLDRKKALDKFKDGGANILVTSDLTSRGIDVPFVDCVINFDIPEDNKFYQHRAGRSGRANADGLCISIATKGETIHLNKIKKYFNIILTQKEMSYGKMVDVTDGNKNNFDKQ